MKIEDFEKLKKKVKEELELNPDNIEQQSIKSGTLHQKYLTVYMKELRIYNRLVAEKDRLYGELYHKYKYPSADDGIGFQFSLDSKSEIDTYINSNEQYYKKRLDIQNQEIIVKYLEKVLDSINKMSFYIRNYIELMKIKHGLSWYKGN